MKTNWKNHQKIEAGGFEAVRGLVWMSEAEKCIVHALRGSNICIMQGFIWFNIVASIGGPFGL